MIYLWEIFMQIKRHGTPLTFQEIRAYVDLGGELLNVEDAKILMALDNLYRSAMNG